MNPMQRPDARWPADYEDTPSLIGQKRKRSPPAIEDHVYDNTERTPSSDYTLDKYLKLLSIASES